MHKNSELHISKHAQKRSQQRALPRHILEKIIDLGCLSDAPGGATEIFLGNKICADLITELKRMIKTIERAKGGTVIICNDTIITAYKQQ